MQQTESYVEPIDTDIRTSPLVGMSISDMVRTALSGVGIGLFTAAVAMLMNKFVFSSVLCRAGSVATDCTNAPLYASIVAIIFGALVGLIVLARMRLYRPLLIVIAATAALWGFHVLTSSMPWYWALIVPALLFGLTYALFAWIARIRSFIIALIVTVVVIVVLRLLLVA